MASKVIKLSEHRGGLAAPRKFKFTEKSLNTIPVPTDRAQIVYRDLELPGFAVVVSKTGRRSFIVESRVAGRQSRKVIGVHGSPRAGGHTWNVTRARRRARELLGEMAAGIDPNKPDELGHSGPTLRAGLEVHLKSMRKRACNERSIARVRAEVVRHLDEWLDKPIVNLTALALDRVVDRIVRETKPRRGAANTPGAATSNRLIRHVQAIWNSTDRLHDLPVKNPATRLTKMSLKPKEARIADGEFKAWYAKVQTLAAIRRDLQLFALFTGVRSEGVRHARWEDIDWGRGVFHVRRAKGNRPYTVPLCKTLIEILKARQLDNLVECQALGLQDDGGWVFPTRTRARPFRVIPVAESKEYRVDPRTGERVQFLPGLHILRKTFNSLAVEIGIAPADREALMNHAGHGVNARHYGFPQNWDHLAWCIAKIEAALLDRLGLK